MRSHSVHEKIPFSLDQHYDLRDYIQDTGQAFDMSMISPDEQELSFALSSKEIRKLGIISLHISKVREPTLNKTIPSKATIIFENRRTGDDDRLEYSAHHGLWKHTTSGNEATLFGANDAACLLASSVKNSSLLIDPSDSSGITSGGIVDSLKWHIERKAPNARNKQSRLYRLDYPTSSLAWDGSRDATMLYRVKTEGGRTSEEVSVASAHNLDPVDERNDLLLATMYRTISRRQSPIDSTGLLQITSYGPSRQKTRDLDSIEKTAVDSHYDRIRRACIHMRDIALRESIFAQ